jgi:hypothetical protein
MDCWPLRNFWQAIVGQIIVFVELLIAGFTWGGSRGPGVAVEPRPGRED